MLGYWGDVEKTLEVITPDRWFHTGDVAVIEENGYGRIVGRMKDMIIRGGENIYPREIEEFLHTHPAIMEAQVDIISTVLTSHLSPLTSLLAGLRCAGRQDGGGTLRLGEAQPGPQSPGGGD